MSLGTRDNLMFSGTRDFNDGFICLLTENEIRIHWHGKPSETKAGTSLFNGCQHLKRRFMLLMVSYLLSFLKALLHKSTPKLLLIWTNKASVARIKPDPPLPILVQRALKVLPSLDWTSGKPEKRTGNFWRSLKKLLPSERVSGYCHRRI